MRSRAVALWLAASLGVLPVGTRAQPVEVAEASITDLSAALSAGRVTSRELVTAYLARIAAYDQQGPALNAIVRTNPKAMAEAATLDAERRAKKLRGPLHGIPVLVKDNYDTADMPTSGGTLALATLQPATDSEQVARLRAAGAIILGKTTMHELAAGITTVSSFTGYSRNPYDPARSPGGSSGGTGAAVAASFAAAGMGSDTCGSIRIPAAYQNLVGLRGTLGLSSTKGIMPLSHSQDVAGPLARSVADLAILLDATVPATVNGARRASYGDTLRPDGLKGARIGVVRAMFTPEDKAGQETVERALSAMRGAGAILTDIQIPDMDEMLKDSSLVALEFRDDLSAYLAAHPGAPVKSLGEIIALGFDHDALDERLRQRDATRRDETAYARAQGKQRALRATLTALMAQQTLDAILYPVTLAPPPLVRTADDSLSASCRLSASSGLPAIAIPAGFTAAGQPIGIELLGPAFTEATLLRLAHGWEKVASPRRAPFSTPPLVNGKAPPPLAFATTIKAVGGAGGATIRFTYDPVTAVLDIASSVVGIAHGDVIALAIHRARANGTGPVIMPLLAAGRVEGSMRLTLAARERRELLAGLWYAELYTRAAPLGAGRASVLPGE
ncbi:MAG: amidase family protein [Sphingobium sp.]